MKSFAFKAFGAVVAAAAITLIAAGLPAMASTPMTGVSATTSTQLAPGQLNAAPIIIGFTSPTALSAASLSQLNVTFPIGVTGFTANASCGASAVLTASPSNTGLCTFGSVRSINVLLSSGLAAGTAWTVTIPANTLTMPCSGSGVTIALNTRDGASVGVIVDSATVTLPFASSPSATVTFDANGGTGSTASQSASVATALTPNGFTRTGYNFVGWNTVADGSGTPYSDGALFDFSSSTTLYAQWTPTLASTGLDASSFVVFAGLMGALGISAVAVAARRRRTA